MRNTLKTALVAAGLVLAPAMATDFQTRIVGGCESSQSAYPWMVAVATKLTSDEFQNTFCGATLIHERWVVTAAHCMFNASNNDLPFSINQLELYIGTTTLNSGEGAHYEISEIHTHPSYNVSLSNITNDIALLKLSSPASETPARLATIKPGRDLEALTAGWGNLVEVTVDPEQEQAPASYPHTLNEVNVMTWDNGTCGSNLQINLANSQLCAGYAAGGKDSCQGDSGGPLVLKSQGQDTLVGIVSYGFGCAQPGLPGVYSSVAAFRDWVAQTTQNDVPAPTVLSENYSDFYACGAGSGAAGSLTTIGSTSSGGGAAGPLLLSITLLGFTRRRVQSRFSANSKNA